MKKIKRPNAKLQWTNMVDASTVEPSNEEPTLLDLKKYVGRSANLS